MNNSLADKIVKIYLLIDEYKKIIIYKNDRELYNNFLPLNIFFSKEEFSRIMDIYSRLSITFYNVADLLILIHKYLIVIDNNESELEWRRKYYKLFVDDYHKSFYEYYFEEGIKLGISEENCLRSYNELISIIAGWNFNKVEISNQPITKTSVLIEYIITNYCTDDTLFITKQILIKLRGTPIYNNIGTGDYISFFK